MVGAATHPARPRTWLLIGLLTSAVILLLLSVALALWLMMPRWFALMVIDHTNSFRVAFAAAAKRSDDQMVANALLRTRGGFPRKNMFPGADVAQVAFVGLRSNDRGIRKLAAYCLWSLTLFETDPPIVLGAIPPDAVEHVVELIDSTQESTNDLTSVLQLLGDPRALPLLLAAYARPGDHANLLHPLSSFDDPQVAEIFLALSHQEPLNGMIGLGLAAMSAPTTTERLMELATDSVHQHRRIALPYLTRKSDARIMPIILAACREMDDDIRTCAFAALTNHGQPEIRAALLTLLADSDENVRYRAAWNLQSYEGTLSDDQRRLINELTRR